MPFARTIAFPRAASEFAAYTAPTGPNSAPGNDPPTVISENSGMALAVSTMLLPASVADFRPSSWTVVVLAQPARAIVAHHASTRPACHLLDLAVIVTFFCGVERCEHMRAASGSVTAPTRIPIAPEEQHLPAGWCREWTYSSAPRPHPTVRSLPGEADKRTCTGAFDTYGGERRLGA